MLCCAKRAMADCMVAPKGATAVEKPTCGCEVRAIPPAPTSARTLLASEDHLGLSPPAGPSPDVRPLALLETNAFRFDVGPPPGPPSLHDASRAPPFVRARPLS